MFPGDDDSQPNNLQRRRVHVSEGEAFILVVDDDAGPGNGGPLRFEPRDDVEDAYLVAIDREYDLYTIAADGPGPDADLLSRYATVVWFTGNDDLASSLSGTLTAADRAALRTYLQVGGSLWLTSPEVLFDLSVLDPAFLRDELHVDLASRLTEDDAGTPDRLDGVAGDVIGDTLSLPVTVPPDRRDRGDAIAPTGDAFGVLYQDPSNTGTGAPFAAIRYNGSARVFYMAQEFAWISTSSHIRQLASRALDHLFSGLTMHIDGSAAGSVRAGRSVNYTAVIENHGSVPRQLSETTIESLPAGWTANLTPTVTGGAPVVTVPGLGTASLLLQVTAPTTALPDQTAKVSIVATPANASGLLRNTTVTRVLPTASLLLRPVLSTQNGEPGKTIRFPVTVRNTGNAKAQVQLTAEADRPLTGFPEPSQFSLEAFSETQINLTVRVPPGTLEAKTYTVRLEGREQVADDSTSSIADVFVAMAQGYDLAIDSLVASDGGRVDPAGPRPLVTVSVNVSNLGNGEDTVRVAVAGQFAGAQEWNFGSANVTLAAFEKRHPVNLTVRPSAKAPAGPFNLTVTATSENGDRAVSSVLLRVLRPNLVIRGQQVRPLGEPVIGKRIPLQVEVLNDNRSGGEGIAGSFRVRFTDDAGQMIDQVPVLEGLAPGASRLITVEWSGVHYGSTPVFAEVDAEQEVIETSEDDNVASSEIFGRGPDLEITNVRIYQGNRIVTAGTAGRQVEVFANVRNGGSFPANTSAITVVFLVEGEPLATRTIDFLERGKDEWVSVNWTPRAGTSELRVRVDPEDLIDERKDDNNEYSLTFAAEPPASAPPNYAAPLAGLVVGLLIVLMYAVATGAIATPFVWSGELGPAPPGTRCTSCRRQVRPGRPRFACACARRYHAHCATRLARCDCGRKLP